MMCCTFCIFSNKFDLKQTIRVLHKGKDNITAIVFIRKIEDLARSNRWMDTTTYANVANNLKGFA